MGGTIWVESELGHGARFIFTIKARLGEKISDNKSERLDRATRFDEEEHMDGIFSGMRMLIAEDIEINKEILLSLLENTGLVIDCAENGKEAVSMVESATDKYNIIFMDVQMPVMDGLEATRRIRALPGCQSDRLPIIAMTANVFKDDVENCLEAGMNDHLSKPLDVEKVFETLSNYLLKR